MPSSTILAARRISASPCWTGTWRGVARSWNKSNRKCPHSATTPPLERVYRRLDAIAELVRRREHRKGGCIIGNLSTALSDTHDAFRRRLAECFDEMALEFKPHLDAAVMRYGRGRRVDTQALARYIVAVVEGSIMLKRTEQDQQVMERHCDYLKEHLKQSLQG